MSDVQQTPWGLRDDRCRAAGIVVGLLILTLVAVLAVSTALTFDDYVQGVTEDERDSIPLFRRWTTIVACTSVAALAVVVLRVLGVVRRPALWIYMLVALVAGLWALMVGVSVATLKL